MRFGDYTLTVRDKQGDVKLFRMYGRRVRATPTCKLFARILEFKGMQVTTGTKANVANEAVQRPVARRGSVREVDRRQ